MKCLYINLDSRTDRRAEAEAEFKRVGLTVERFPAFTGDNRPLAFNKSVYACMKLAEGEDLLLFEDDVVFEGDGLKPGQMVIPDDCLTLHLGCNILGVGDTVWEMPTQYNSTLSHLTNCFQSHATYYSKECVDFILANMRVDIMDEHNNIFDDWLRRNVLHQRRSYVLNPMICYQRPSVSDIWGEKWTDYTGAHTKGNELLKQLR